jgi:hypothetical protein
MFEAYNSLPKQLLEENHKFQYGHVKSGARASQFLCVDGGRFPIYQRVFLREAFLRAAARSSHGR